MHFTGYIICLLASVGIIFQKQRLLEAPGQIPGIPEAESSATNQKSEVRGPNWREKGFCGPRSEAAMALPGPLFRVRGFEGCIWGGGRQLQRMGSGQGMYRTARSERGKCLHGLVSRS